MCQCGGWVRLKRKALWQWTPMGSVPLSDQNLLVWGQLQSPNYDLTTGGDVGDQDWNKPKRTFNLYFNSNQQNRLNSQLLACKGFSLAFKEVSLRLGWVKGVFIWGSQKVNKDFSEVSWDEISEKWAAYIDFEDSWLPMAVMSKTWPSHDTHGCTWQSHDIFYLK